MSNVIDPLCERPIEFGCVDNSHKCSPLFSKSVIGDYCRDEYAQLSPGDRDTVMQNFCLRNPRSEECKCASRSDEATYLRLKSGQPFSDACWYVPCTNRFQYFIPSEFDGKLECPQNVCQIVYNISEQRNLDMSDIKNDINCDFNTRGGGGGGEKEKEKEKDKNVPATKTSISRIYYYALVVLALYILVYLIKKG